MPEQPPEKRRPRSSITHVTKSTNLPKGVYAELHCRSNFSFLSAASHPDELVTRANELGYAALAITDRNSVAGVVRAHVAAKDLGVKLLIGAEITTTDSPPIVLWSMNRTGYGRLCRLITRGRRNAPKGECSLTLSDVLEHSEGLLAGLVLRESETSLIDSAGRLREAFSDRLYLLAELHRGGDDLRQLRQWMADAQQLGLPLVAANDVQYHVRERQRLHDVLSAIKHGCSVEDLGYRRWPNAERHLKSATEMASLFELCPEAIAQTVEIADRCHFSLDELRYDYPEEICPPGLTQMEYLTQLTWAGAQSRYSDTVSEKVKQLIKHELSLIEELNYAAYFLTVWDLVRFAREKEILCQGRGSAANSAVCYCLGVTPVNPDQIEVLFERFISKERNEAPDIDIDFEHSRREEVIQYLYDKYGRERSGMTATVICYRPRSAIRDVGKALGLSLDRVDALAKHIDHYQDSKELAIRLREAGLPPESRLGRNLVSLVTELLGFPRHLSQHVGGVVLTNSPLCELVPIENASMPGRTVIEFDKDDLDVLGILKVDVLALGMLTAIRRAFALVEQHHNQQLTIATIPSDDQAVFEMIGQADTIGVFQIESRAQMSMLPRMKPKNFYDLVIEVSLVRPGPIQGDMVNPYLRRRCNEEEPTYPSAEIKAVLERTLGVPIFQEQAMRLVVVAAGFTPGEADQFRRAMGAWRRRGLIENFHKKLVEGMISRRYTEEFAERLFRQISGFGEYGFPESHACSFAILVWVSAWLKHYYPAAFTAALINSQPMGFYAPSQLVADARKHKVVVLPVDINQSEWDCTLETSSGEESSALRLGFRLLKGLSQSDANAIVATRGSRPFTSMDDFFHRTNSSNAVAACLSRGDVFRSLQLNRRESLWQSLPDPDPGPLFAGVNDEEPQAELPQMTSAQETFADYRSSGMTLRGHPLSFIRSDLDKCGVSVAASLTDASKKDRRCRVAGLVLIRQRPSTAKGITFMTLEDETGTANLVVHVNTWERFRKIARGAAAMIAHGILQQQHGTVHLVVDRMEDLTPLLGEVGNKSRDFH
jgi:error-prone DNA polymerase